MHAPGVCERKATTVNNERILNPYMRSILFPVQKKNKNPVPKSGCLSANFSPLVGSIPTGLENVFHGRMRNFSFITAFTAGIIHSTTSQVQSRSAKAF